MSTKKYDEVWAVDAERIRAFFDDQCSGYSGEFEIAALPEKSIGTRTLPQTRIIICGDKADELYRRFFLKFMTAGG